MASPNLTKNLASLDWGVGCGACSLYLALIYPKKFFLRFEGWHTFLVKSEIISSSPGDEILMQHTVANNRLN